MNDQRSTTDQLRDAVHILNREGLYDAADFCRREVERATHLAGTPWTRRDSQRGIERWTRIDGRGVEIEWVNSLDDRSWIGRTCDAVIDRIHRGFGALGW